jgi:hypothetical protein
MAGTFTIDPAHTGVLSMDCQAGIVSIYALKSAIADVTSAMLVPSSSRRRRAPGSGREWWK